jgi:hypothetical protein
VIPTLKARTGPLGMGNWSPADVTQVSRQARPTDVEASGQASVT